jgi:hypothetical protein
MNDRDVDKLLEQALSGGGAPEALGRAVLRDSLAALDRDRTERVRWRVAGLAVAAAFIAVVSFLSGRASAPRAAPEPVVTGTQTPGATQTVNVPGELVAWLDAARFFKRLGMQDRVTLAYERAERLVPRDTPFAESAPGVTYAARTEADEDRSESVDKEISIILAHAFGG